MGRSHLFAAHLMLGLWTTSAGSQSTTVSTSDAVIERRVDALLTGAIRPDGPGCAVGVYRNGRTVLSRGYGLANMEDGRPITARTAFSLGSLSKPFTAFAALTLQQQGKLSLDDDIRRWLPEMPSYGAPVRVRDLLQHTSGVRDFQALETLSGRSVNTMAEFLGLLVEQRALNFSPGAQHEYSHSDFGLLGLVIERVVGVPFGEHLERDILGPLGMKGSFVHDARGRSRKERAFGHIQSPSGIRVEFPGSHLVGGENLYASIEDLAHWDRHMDEPTAGGAAVMARMLSRPQLANGDTIPYAYGLRLGSYRGLRTVSRGGRDDGNRTEMMRFPDQRLTVAVLCNTDRIEPWRLGQAIADLYLESQMQPARPQPVAPPAVVEPADALRRFTGLYRSVEQPWDLIPVEVRNGVLGEVVFDPVDDEIFEPLTPSGGGRFFMIGITGNIGSYIFRSDASGAPVRLDITWRGALGDFSNSLERIADSAVWKPTIEALAEYTGTWFSQELDASWQLEPREGKLRLRRRGQPGLTLRPAERDSFVRGFGESLVGQLQFQRDAGGRLTHLSVSTPPGEESARDVRFIRVIPN